MSDMSDTNTSEAFLNMSMCCPRCGHVAKVKIVPIPFGRHHGKRVCPKCERFLGFVPKTVMDTMKGSR